VGGSFGSGLYGVVEDGDAHQAKACWIISTVFGAKIIAMVPVD
jgi:hypothetical protein